MVGQILVLESICPVSVEGQLLGHGVVYLQLIWTWEQAGYNNVKSRNHDLQNYIYIAYCIVNCVYATISSKMDVSLKNGLRMSWSCSPLACCASKLFVNFQEINLIAPLAQPMYLLLDFYESFCPTSCNLEIGTHTR